ncbi:MAG: MbcA/ParS/Xre antitoxin family protein [Gammaproteobacteria bacterium]|uniref:MbcA/ParS/Xre antitoxin family protein n=1 Tax=Rhodoferax sp. TaxID=50421 RepID=UPI0017AD33DB|nr:MbcA/ParS/Xre antitoxin family protein [Rhodoferax sp.]MBU3899469.1 MbcA/ParS/Xre antitoxin family protein [Gammaproteobacteria bacterium]MBA3059539.1 DUF2384 domain-containing protein [Rhodoferax sp.]MBU3998718.1 MbcA/ParS/Xre antitoxin family protein [Gammaproteobacteria bacterium]MBU4017945.1 MbcA/ParS/Xre antitoxin family protein [Gammaproteobacteria bacterium]MBU4080365.1 MbcA/ParS/Xre antitoxin family protein [Gammaproteobacteria bacterium]
MKKVITVPRSPSAPTRIATCPTDAGENVLRLLELDGIAAKTFATEAAESAWFRRAHPMLDGETPLAAAKTPFGAQRVKDILLAIKYGGVV